VDAGLISFLDGRACITLPFIQSYLFADEMSKRPDLADDYLSSVRNDVDLSIFDLYAEIGPSKSSVDRVIRALSSSITSTPCNGDNHMLLSGALSPVVLKNPARIRNLSQKVSQARAAVEEGASHRDEKARILDIAERVNEDVAEHSQRSPREPEETSEALRDIIELIRSWTVATILLGSGAESINGKDRQILAETIIYGGEALLDSVLKHLSALDFEEIKNQIVSDAEFRGHVGVDDDAEFEASVSALVDLIEFLALSEPLDYVFDSLPDRARHKIVGNSVAKARTETPIQALIKYNWLANINPAEAKAELLKTLHALPHVHFLRASLTTLYIMRVKWKVPEAETRHALLDAAEEAVRPYNPYLDKGEIIRFVERRGTDPDEPALG
jgi:hypothetical protein